MPASTSTQMKAPITQPTHTRPLYPTWLLVAVARSGALGCPFSAVIVPLLCASITCTQQAGTRAARPHYCGAVPAVAMAHSRRSGACVRSSSSGSMSEAAAACPPKPQPCAPLAHLPHPNLRAPLAARARCRSAAVGPRCVAAATCAGCRLRVRRCNKLGGLAEQGPSPRNRAAVPIKTGRPTKGTRRLVAIAGAAQHLSMRQSRKASWAEG